MFCPKCGSETQEGAQFCWNCGAELPVITGEGKIKEKADVTKDAVTRQLLVPPALSADQYDHPLDRSSLAQVRKLAPVVALVKMMIQNWDEPLVRADMLGMSIRVGPKQFPEIHKMVQECAEILHIPEPEVFIKQNPHPNAMAFGVNKPFIILHSSLIDTFTQDELRSIIGHEMGHIKSEHVLYLSAAFFLTQQAAQLAQRLFGIGQLIATPVRVALTNWQRQAEYTADRAGIICVQDVRSSVMAMAKLLLGSRRFADRIDIDEFMKQSQGDGYSTLLEGLSTHPLIGNRVREMGTFFDSDQYRRIFQGARLLGAAETDEIGSAAVFAAPELSRADLAEAALKRGLVVLQEQGLTPRGIMSHLAGDAKELEQAVGEFELATVLDPDGEQGIAGSFYSGIALIYLGQIKQARAVLEELRSKHPQHQLAKQAHDVLRRLA